MKNEWFLTINIVKNKNSKAWGSFELPSIRSKTDSFTRRPPRYASWVSLPYLFSCACTLECKELRVILNYSWSLSAEERSIGYWIFSCLFRNHTSSIQWECRNIDVPNKLLGVWGIPIIPHWKIWTII